MADFKSLKNLNKDDQNIQDYLTALEQDRMEKGVSNLPLFTFQTKSPSLPEATDLDSILARKRALRLMSRQPYSAGEPGLEEPIASPLDLIPMGAVTKAGPAVAKHGFKALKFMRKEAPRFLAEESGEVGLKNIEKSKVLRELDITNPKDTLEEVADNYFKHGDEDDLAGRGILDVTGESNVDNAIKALTDDLQKKFGIESKIGPNPRLRKKGAVGEYNTDTNKLYVDQQGPATPRTLGIAFHEGKGHGAIRNINPELSKQTINEAMFTPDKIDEILKTLDPNDPNYKQFRAYLLNKRNTLLNLEKVLQTPFRAAKKIELSPAQQELLDTVIDPKAYNFLRGSLPYEDPYKAIDMSKATKYLHFPKLTPEMEFRNSVYDIVQNMSKFDPKDIKVIKSINDPSINALVKRKFQSIPRKR